MEKIMDFLNLWFSFVFNNQKKAEQKRSSLRKFRQIHFFHYIRDTVGLNNWKTLT